MQLDDSSDLKVLDCTIRDGGYINNWFFDKKFVRELYRNLSKSGVDYIELGFRGTEKYFKREDYGQWRFSEESLINEVTSDIYGSKIALMVDFGKIDSDDFELAKNSKVSLIRIAVHKNNIQDMPDLVEKIKSKGYEVTLNAMGISNYSSKDFDTLYGFLRTSGVDYVFIADSYGSMYPEQIRPIIEPFLEISNLKVGFHSHNNLQMAFANTREAIKCGVHVVDSTMFGMGRGAGNLPTEILCAYLQNLKNEQYNVIPILNFIDMYLIHIQKTNPWGYRLPFMLSGIFDCHPNYAKEFIDRKRYTMEEIWNGLEYIKKQFPVGYKQELVNNVISGGLNVEKDADLPQLSSKKQKPARINPSSEKEISVPYKNRHKNTPFLILANGPNLKKDAEKIGRFIHKYNPIVMGANYLGGIFLPHYHAFTSKKRFVKYADQVDPQSTLLMSQHFQKDFIDEYITRDYQAIYYKDNLDDFTISESGVILTNCRTVSILLLGVALVMGASKIFAVGMDGYMSNEDDEKFLFYEEDDEIKDQQIIIERQALCQKYMTQIDSYDKEQGGEGVHILTPTSYKNLYKGIDNYL